MSFLSNILGNDSPKGSFRKLLRMQWKFSIREPLGFGMGIIFPILLLIVFGIIGFYAGGDYSGLSVFDLYVPTIIVIGLMSVAVYSIPFTLVRDREVGWLRRVSTTPLSPQKLLLSLLIVNLVYGLATIIIILLGSVFIFGAPVNINVIFFVLSIILTISVMFSIGFLIAAIAPNQRVSQGLTGAVFFSLLFFSGLWIQPAMVGDPLKSIIYYSPSGAAVKSLLDSVFNLPPVYIEFVAMILYSVIFTALAVKYFKWT